MNYNLTKYKKRKTYEKQIDNETTLNEIKSVQVKKIFSPQFKRITILASDKFTINFQPRSFDEVDGVYRKMDECRDWGFWLW